MTENERSGSFCSTFMRLLTSHLERERGKGKKDIDIIHELQQKCPSTDLSTWYRRFEHIDTCQKINVKPEQLTQTETRKFRKLTRRDQTRLIQCFTDLQKNNGDQPARKLFKQSYRRIEPLVLKRKAAAPQNLSRPTKSTTDSSESETGKIRASSGEKPPHKHSERVTIEWQEPSSIPQGLIKTRDGSLYDPSRSYPEECRSHNDDCPALAMWRLHMVEVMNR